MSKSDYDYSFELGRKMERTPGSFNQGMSPSGFANGPAGGSPKQGSPHSHSSHSSSPSNSSYSSVGESGSNSNLSRLRVEMPSQRLEVLQDPPSYSSVDALLNSAESRLSKTSDPWSMTSSWTGTTTSTMSRNTFSPPSQPLRPPVSALPEMSYKPPSPAYVSYDQQQRMPSASPNYPHHTHHNARAGPVGYSPHRSAPPSMNHNRPAYAQMPGFPATPSYQAYAQQGGYGSRLDPHSAKFSPAMSMPNMLPGAMGTKGGNMKRAPMPLDGYIYQIQFKRAFKNYVLGPAAPRDLVPGDFVKVEADRGEDLGVVLSKTRMEDFEEVMPTAGYRGRGFASGQGERKCILRLASPDERAAVLTKVYDEEVALQTIREKIADRGFVMSILDAEYQFDRHKLTFYFEADHRIDFRELVSELFSHYKTRIWMQQVDTSAVDPHDPGTELAKMSGLLPDRGEESISAQSSLSGITTEHRSHNSSFSAWPETDHLAPVSTDSYAYNVYRPCPPAAEQRGQDYHGGYAGYETSTSSASWLRY